MSARAWIARAFARVACIASLLALLGCDDGSSPADPAPRVLVITIDTLRRDHVRAYGGVVPTPTLDGLATRGALLLDAYTPTPTTAPAHASLWTGLHPWRHGVSDNAVPLPGDVATVPERAREGGVATAAFVSSFILDTRFGWSRGFETYHFEPSESYPWRGRRRGAFWTRAAATTDAALAWLAEHRNGPFLLWVHYFDPHAPFEAPPGFERPASERVSLEAKTLPPGVASFAQLADLIRGYRGDVAYTDAQLGRLLDGLAALGLAESTAVLVTSDHGEGLGDHGLLEHGENLHEELVRIPLLVRGPGIPPARRLAGAAQLEDLAPTILELLGLPAPPGIDGASLLPWLRGAATGSPRDTAVGRRKPYAGRPDQFFARRAEQKWIGPLTGEGVAYRLDADAGELHGVAAPDPPEAIARLGDAARTRAPARVIDTESRRALEALGYIER
jgi:arylsulfatase A-like enzyme